MKRTLHTLITLTACLWLVGTGIMDAQTDEIKARELELKQKQLDLEKAKLDTVKSEQLSVEKARVELARKELELAKARQALAVKETGNQIQMQLSGEVFFDTNAATLKAAAREKLRQVGIILAAYPQGAITIAGYTDSRGSEETNLDLSRKRAEAVKVRLMNQSGIKEDRIAVKALGEAEPVASNDTAAGRRLNRRVEIVVQKG